MANNELVPQGALTDALPGLPACAASYNGGRFYDEDQMHAYVLADRAARSGQVSDAADAARWIAVTDRLPENRQAVAFVVDCNSGMFGYLDRRVLGGTYVAGQGFGIPGLSISASHWMPLPAPPAIQAQAGDALANTKGEA